MHIPDYMPVLQRGAHRHPSQGACVMEYVSLLAGEEWSDYPSCTTHHVARLAQFVNDRLTDDERNDVMIPMIPVIMRTAGLDMTAKIAALFRESDRLMVAAAKQNLNATWISPTVTFNEVGAEKPITTVSTGVTYSWSSLGESRRLTEALTSNLRAILDEYAKQIEDEEPTVTPEVVEAAVTLLVEARS